LRESATTTLKKGRFLAPPRANLMTTMIPPEQKKALIIRRKIGQWQSVPTAAGKPRP